MSRETADQKGPGGSSPNIDSLLLSSTPTGSKAALSATTASTTSAGVPMAGVVPVPSKTAHLLPPRRP